MAQRGSEAYRARKLCQQQEYLEKIRARELNLLDRAEAITDTSKDQRIYVVVADTVQNSIGLDLADGHEILFRDRDSKTIVQLPGRLMAQVGHVVSLTRMMMAKRCFMGIIGGPTEEAYLDKVWMTLSKPITTIVLAAKDSFELHHIHRLLEKKLNERTYAFYDENPPVYGNERKIMTAIATEPIPFTATEGVLDYLPLWTVIESRLNERVRARSAYEEKLD